MAVVWEHKVQYKEHSEPGVFSSGNKIAFAGAQNGVHMFNELSRKKVSAWPR